jgi:membrane fusion protein, multidrug efflux system
MHRPKHPLRQKLLPAAAGLAVVIFAVALTGCKQQQKPAPAPDVEVIVVAQKNVPIYSEWVGTLEGLVNAQIQPRVTGYLIAQNYKEGSFVKTGDLLFEIDPRPYQAALDQAKAQRAQALAALGKAEIDVKRLTPLAKEQVVSQQELDNAIQAYLGNKAAVAAAEAAVAQAELNLSFTKVRSPIDGIAGIAQAQVGDLVAATVALTTISTVDPIKVYFSVSEQEHLNWFRQHPDPVERAASERNVELEMTLADGSLYPHKGKFSFADRQVDVKTGALRVQGLFPNPGNVLRPGQFARVKAATMIKTGALLVPQRAVTELQGTYQVAVVGGDNRVHIRPVKVGERIGPMWIIDQGLKPGERVVAEGVQKVKEGLAVNPKPFAAVAEAPAAPGGPPKSN